MGIPMGKFVKIPVKHRSQNLFRLGHQIVFHDVMPPVIDLMIQYQRIIKNQRILTDHLRPLLAILKIELDLCSLVGRGPAHATGITDGMVDVVQG